MRIWCAVMPGADAVAAPEDEGEEELPQPAAIIAAATAAAAIAGVRTRCDLFM
jgi:hypothetical protein